MCPNLIEKTENYVKQIPPKENHPKHPSVNKLPPKSLSMLHNNPTNTFTRKPSKNSAMNNTLHQQFSNVEKLISDSTTGNNPREERKLSLNHHQNSSLSNLSVTSKSPINVRRVSVNDHNSNSSNRIPQPGVQYKIPLNKMPSHAKFNSMGSRRASGDARNHIGKSNRNLESNPNLTLNDGMVLRPIEGANGQSVYVLDFQGNGLSGTSNKGGPKEKTGKSGKLQVGGLTCKNESTKDRGQLNVGKKNSKSALGNSQDSMDKIYDTQGFGPCAGNEETDNELERHLTDFLNIERNCM
jgi:hypothetical protein